MLDAHGLSPCPCGAYFRDMTALLTMYIRGVVLDHMLGRRTRCPGFFVVQHVILHLILRRLFRGFCDRVTMIVLAILFPSSGLDIVIW